MGRHSEDKIEYYYDSHSTEKDLAGEPSVHAMLVRYLINVLNWMFRGQVCAIYKNLNFYYTPDPSEYPMEPDVAILKSIRPQAVRSWKVGRSGPPPEGGV